MTATSAAVRAKLGLPESSLHWSAYEARYQALLDTDLALLSDLGVDAYRFSVSWTRFAAADGTGAGPDFYDRLVDRLLATGIEPWPNASATSQVRRPMSKVSNRANSAAKSNSGSIGIQSYSPLGPAMKPSHLSDLYAQT